MSRAILTVRMMARTGRHLYEDFSEPAKRHEGWQLMQRARRIARRLGIGGLI